MILLNYGIVLENNELKVIGNEKDFPQKNITSFVPFPK
jgi:hypothetical protein